MKIKQSNRHKWVHVNGTMNEKDVLIQILKDCNPISFVNISKYSFGISVEYPLLKYDLSKTNVTKIVQENPETFSFVGNDSIQLNLKGEYI